MRDEVRRTTAGRQEPFIYGSLGGSIIPLVPSPVAKALEAMAAQDPVVPPSVALTTPAPVIGKPPTAPASVLPAPVGAPPAAPPSEPSQSMQSRLQAALEKEDQVSACRRDEQRLARVRSMPSADEIVRFERELGCTRLKPQVQRLFESIATTRPAAEAKPEEPRKEPLPALALTREQPVVGAEPQGACARDADRLAQLRGDPTPDAIARLDRELGCERLRPQLRRLRESLQ